MFFHFFYGQTQNLLYLFSGFLLFSHIYDVIMTSQEIFSTFLVDIDRGDNDLYISIKYSIIGAL